MATVLAVVLAATVAVTAPAPSAQAASTYRQIDITLTTRVDPVDNPIWGCPAVFPAAGTYKCRGTFDAGGTKPWADRTGSFGWDRLNSGAPILTTVQTGGGVLIGYAAEPASAGFPMTSSLSVSGGATSWAGHLRTPDEAGKAPGEQGGPLALSLTPQCPQDTCALDIALTGWVLAETPLAAPAPAAGEATMSFNLYLDATGTPIIDEPCTNGWYARGAVATCEGTYRATAGSEPTTAPFNAGHGTEQAITNFDDPGFVSFYVVGAELNGRVAGDSSANYPIDSGTTPWGTNLHTPAGSQIPAGLPGGPLYIDAEGHAAGYTLHVYGTIYYTPTSAEVPLGSIPRAVVPAGNVAQAVAVMPRFTG